MGSAVGRAAQLILDSTSPEAEARAALAQASRLYTAQLKAGPLNLHIRTMILRVFEAATKRGVSAIEPVAWSMKEIAEFHQVSLSTVKQIVAAAVGSGMVRRDGDGRSANSYTIDVDAARQWLRRASESRPPVAETIDRERFLTGAAREECDDAPPDGAGVMRPPGVAVQPLEVVRQPPAVAGRLPAPACARLVSSLEETLPPPPDREIRNRREAGGGRLEETRVASERGEHGESEAAAADWSREECVAAAAAIRRTGLDRVGDAIELAQERGLAVGELATLCAEFEANRRLFRGPGALLSRLRDGIWPAAGVRPVSQVQAVQERTSARRAREALELRLFVIVRERKAAGDDDDAIRAALAAELPIEFLKAQGWA